MAAQKTPSLGLTVSSEEHPPERMVEIARLAEQNGFDFISVSDHFHPWVTAQGHSPFVWSVLGAIAASTDSIQVGVGVTCPIMRVHPAILAQAVATTALLLDGRLVWGVGTGEALNELILGHRWPPHEIRAEMLEEAVGLIRRMWAEESVTHRGTHYTVEDARILDRPNEPTPIVVSAFGPNAARLAAEIGDGLWVTGPAEEAIEVYRDAGGVGPVYSQLTLCWDEDRDRAVETAHELWAFSSLPGQLNQDLRTIAHFEQAVEAISPADVARSTPCGPKPEPILELAGEMVDAGVDHLYFHQIGPDQEGFVDFWKAEIRPEMVG
ncbi:MAG TPA: TIGR03557 family F420-dependent LLM class oxidoreductase [Acidimicrobiia bacterium]|nr:TIGR03557 family F420-dependent LLM class oxidoreductase [Acidimicrobiia bacterium]